MIAKISTIVMAMVFLLAAKGSVAQTTAMDFNTTDCNGNTANLYADLDAGKAVVLFYFMPSCGSCPPPAQKIQAMANNINAAHPGKVKAYAFPFNNTTTCSYSQSWVSSNGLPLYAPMDSGATAVAHYGGFGMPTVVLVGGNNHRVMFSTLSFSTSDTTIMRDSILALIGAPTGINDVPDNINSLSVYPNPATTQVTVSVDLKEQSDVTIDIVDIVGKQIAVISKDKNANGSISRTFNTDVLANGIYTIRINANGKTVNRKLNVAH
jgi:peroxiredoxin